MLISTRAHTHAHTYSRLYCVCAVLLLFTSDQAFVMIQSRRGFCKIHGHNIFTEKTVCMKNGQSYVPLRRKDVL